MHVHVLVVLQLLVYCQPGGKLYVLSVDDVRSVCMAGNQCGECKLDIRPYPPLKWPGYKAS